MEITINTKQDSKDELRKLAQFLLSLSEGVNVRVNRNLFDDPSPSITPTTETTQAATNAFAGMFGDSTLPEPSSGLQTFDVNSALQEEKKEEEAPKIVPY